MHTLPQPDQLPSPLPLAYAAPRGTPKMPWWAVVFHTLAGALLAASGAGLALASMLALLIKATTGALNSLLLLVVGLVLLGLGVAVLWVTVMRLRGFSARQIEKRSAWWFYVAGRCVRAVTRPHSPSR